MIIVQEKKNITEGVDIRPAGEVVTVKMCRKPGCYEDLKNDRYSSREVGIVQAIATFDKVTWGKFKLDFNSMDFPSLKNYGGRAGSNLNGLVKFVCPQAREEFFVNPEGYTYPRYAGFKV